MKNFNFVDKELLCMQTFDQNGPYWHIATPGISTEILFTNKDEYKFGMSLVAESACAAGIRVFSFSVTLISTSTSFPRTGRRTRNSQLYLVIPSYSQTTRCFQRPSPRLLKTTM